MNHEGTPNNHPSPSAIGCLGMIICCILEISCFILGNFPTSRWTMRHLWYCFAELFATFLLIFTITFSEMSLSFLIWEMRFVLYTFCFLRRRFSLHSWNERLPWVIFISVVGYNGRRPTLLLWNNRKKVNIFAFYWIFFI